MKTGFKLKQIISFLLVATMILACNKPSKEDIAREQINQIMEQTGAVGLALAVVKDGEIIFSESFGYKNIEQQTLLAKDDIFRIASISKSFTTVALMTLVEQGIVDLNSDVSDLVGFTVRNPEFPETVITLKMLLSHTSSMNDTQGYFNLNVLNPATNPDFGKCYNQYEPGSKYQYCNLGFNTIGAIVEKFSGVRFDNYVADVVLKPLGLTASFNVDSLDASKYVPLYSLVATDTTEGAERVFTEQPAAYASRAADIESGYVMGYSTPLFSPTGGMKISAHDLAKYMTMHMYYGQDPATGVRIISEESSKLMQTPVAEMSEGNFYALALRTTTTLIPGETMVGHTGSAYGLFSAMFFEPDKKFGFVMMTNGCEPVYTEGFTEIQGNVIRALYDVFVK